MDPQLRENIEDAMVHMEDMGFECTISGDYIKFVDDNQPEREHHAVYSLFQTNVYEVIKRHIKDNDSYTVSLSSEVSLSKPNQISIYKFDEWQKMNSELSTAIKRITKNLDSVSIKNSMSEISLMISTSREFNVSNLLNLKNQCTIFNNLFAPHLVIYPEFHYEKGITIYIREIPSKNEDRFSVYNGQIHTQHNHKEFIKNNFNIINKFESGEAEKDNKFLLEKKDKNLAKFIIYELEPKIT